jgi:hypothetical protein
MIPLVQTVRKKFNLVFCKKKIQSVAVYLYLSKLCINIHICDLSIKGLTWILCSHDSLVKRQLQQFWQNQKRLSWLLFHVKPHCISLHKDFAILCTFILQKTPNLSHRGIFHGNKRINILMSFNDGCLGILNRNDV